MTYLPFPDISPEIFSFQLGPITIALRWYALAYIVGLIAGWKMIEAMLRRPALFGDNPPMKPEKVEDLLTWVILGVILGGRMGYVLFYQPGAFLQNPSHILRIWEGGMSFHGGFIGVVIAGLWYARRNGIPPMALGDLMATVAPIGLFLGRIANFINAELWGRETSLPWGVAFPGEAAQTCATLTICARHPSQLYEAALEGLILFGVLVYLIWRKGWLIRSGRITGVFLSGYGLARFLVEFVRQPDAQFVTLGNPLGLAVQVNGFGLTMGQILSLPMIAVGLWLIRRK